MLPAARLALPPRLPRCPPPAWRWAAAGPPAAAGLRALGTGRAQRSEALAGAPLDTAGKEYSPKVRQLVRDIAGLTLLEVADLNALLKETLKIPDVAVMPAAAASLLPSQAAPQEEEVEIPLKKEKTHFTVRLTELKPADKVKLIKEVKNFVQGVNLVQAKKLVESLPQEIKANVSKQEAEKIKAALEAAGGTVVLERGRGLAQSGAHGGAARVALVFWRPRFVRRRLLHPPAGPTEGPPADAAGGEDADDGDGDARDPQRRLPGALQRAQRLTVPADDVLLDSLCHLRDCEGPPGPGQPGASPLLPEGAAGCSGRFHRRVRGDPSRPGERQDAERHEAAARPAAQLFPRPGRHVPRPPGRGLEETLLRSYDGIEPRGPGHCWAALLLRPVQAAGSRDWVAVGQHLHSLPGQLHCWWMCHIPVPAPGCAQDPAHELPGRVPGRYPLCHGNCQARPPRLLQGFRSCCRPAGSSHHPHLCLPGTAAQIFWDQSHHLSRRDGTLPRPRGVSTWVTTELPEPTAGASAAPPAPRPRSRATPAPGGSRSQSPLSSPTPASQHLHYLGNSPGPRVPSALVGLGVFFTVSPLYLWPRALSLPLSVPSLAGAGLCWPGRPGTPVTGPPGLGGPVATLQQGLCRGQRGGLAPSLCCKQQGGGSQAWCSDASSSLRASGSSSSSADPSAPRPPPSAPWPPPLPPASPLCPRPPPTPSASAQPKLASARQPLGSSGIVPRTNDRAGSPRAPSTPGPGVGGRRLSSPALRPPAAPRPGQTPAPPAPPLPPGPPAGRGCRPQPPAVCTPAHGGPEGSKNWNSCDLNDI